MWSDGSGKATYTNWASGEPNNKAGVEHCVNLKVANGKWHDLTCDSSTVRAFVCQIRAFWHNYLLCLS